MIQDVRIVSRDIFLLAMGHPQFKRTSALTGRYGETILVTLEPPEAAVAEMLEVIGGKVPGGRLVW
jgi:hypothetical protein